jgi:hypothetical protein
MSHLEFPAPKGGAGLGHQVTPARLTPPHYAPCLPRSPGATMGKIGEANRYRQTLTDKAPTQRISECGLCLVIYAAKPGGFNDQKCPLCEKARQQISSATPPIWEV